MTAFTEQDINIIKSIPEGKVMTYGQIAKFAGSPRGARQVVRILHSMSKKYRLPWHRVVNSKGEIALKDDGAFQIQKLFLQSEGIEFNGQRTIDLGRFQHDPS
ncbi:MAG: MGMT family protein [Tuberibacillus sp.]